jgi:integrase
MDYLGDDCNEPSNPTGYIHADGPNGSDKLVMAGLPTYDISTMNTTSEMEQFIKQFIKPFIETMKTNAYSPQTVTRYERTLITLAKRNADIFNPESVKAVISKQAWANGTKQSAVNTIRLFYKVYKIKCETEFPEWKRDDRMIFIPLEQELDQLIAGCRGKLCIFLQTLKETAMRYGETLALTWKDYDIATLTLNVNTPEKHSNPRACKISPTLATMINSLPHDKQTIFGYSGREAVRRHFQRARKRIAKNLQNPRLLQIHFHTFRHWKATRELHRTNNVYLVMKLLGHKSLSNTQRYLHLLPELSDDYVCEIATTTQQVKKLVEDGYDYVQTTNGNEYIYKKRK